MSDDKCPKCRRRIKRVNVILRETNTYKGEFVDGQLVLYDGRTETIHPNVVGVECPHCRERLDMPYASWRWGT